VDNFKCALAKSEKERVDCIVSTSSHLAVYAFLLARIDLVGGKPPTLNLAGHGLSRLHVYEIPTTVCHEHKGSQQAVGVRNCLTDEGRPLGIGLQEQVPNHLRRLWPKAMVVNAEGKGPGFTGSGDRQEEDRKGITDEVSKVIR
jgi:hypothetical protein